MLGEQHHEFEFDITVLAGFYDRDVELMCLEAVRKIPGRREYCGSFWHDDFGRAVVDIFTGDIVTASSSHNNCDITNARF